MDGKRIPNLYSVFLLPLIGSSTSVCPEYALGRKITVSAVETTDLSIIGHGLYFEDFHVGMRFKTVGRTITDVDIINFVGATGMNEILFTNYEYQKTALLNGRVAPGALVYAFAEGLILTPTAQFTGLAFLEMHLKMQQPVFSLDTIHVQCEVVEMRRTRSEGRGIIKTSNQVLNQNGGVVMTYTPVRMWKTRPSAQPQITSQTLQ